MKKLSIMALTLSLLMICVGCTVQSDNNDSKDTEGKTSVSVSQNSEESTQESRNGKTDGATASNGKNEQSTLQSASDDYAAEIITIEPGDKSDNSSDKKETTTEKNGENKREETTSSPKETPVIPIP